MNPASTEQGQKPQDIKFKKNLLSIATSAVAIEPGSFLKEKDENLDMLIQQNKDCAANADSVKWTIAGTVAGTAYGVFRSLFCFLPTNSNPLPHFSKKQRNLFFFAFIKAIFFFFGLLSLFAAAHLFFLILR